MNLNLFEKANIAKLFPLAFITAFFIFQLAYIHADTPYFLTDDAGAYCDEGYKTNDARNLVLFGNAKWSENDEYRGWLKKSPITVYYNWLLFKLFGVSLAVARLGNLLFALGSLFLFYLILHKSYDFQTALLSLILCGVNQVFFFYSRLALLEFKMMFFILLGLYCMLFIKQSYLFGAPAAACLIAAYYCKALSVLFYISLILFVILTYKRGFLLSKILQIKNLIICALILIASVVLIQFYLVHHREHYDSLFFFGRHFRSPVGALLFWPTQEFFTKNPLIAFLAIIYIGRLVILIVEGKPYNRNDLFLLIWVVSGTVILAVVSYQPLRYYVYLVFPATALAVRSILHFSSNWKSLFEKRNALLRGTIFVLSFYLLIIHTGFIPFVPVYKSYQWVISAVKFFGVFSAAIIVVMAFIYIYLRKRKEIGELFFNLPNRNITIFLVVSVLSFHLMPITKWALNPKFELDDIARKICEFNDDSIIVGDWAPQLCINTDRKVLYQTTDKNLKWTMNLKNLAKIKPNFLVIVDGLNDRILRLFKLRYPAAAQDNPQYIFPYAGRSIHFYELNFAN